MGGLADKSHSPCGRYVWQNRLLSRGILAFALAAGVFSAGCEKVKTVRSYEAPKETPSVIADSGSANPDMPAAPAGFPADLRWTLPRGWTQAAVPGAAGAAFRPDAAIRVSPDDPKLLLTISHLGDSPFARSVLENVNRWAGQIQAPKMTEADLPKGVTHIAIGDQSADVAELDGEGRKMLGAIVPHASETWFIKLSGESAAVGAQKENFLQFVKSLHFDTGNSAPAPANPPANPIAGPGEAASPVAAGVAGATWTLPNGWTATPGDSFRVATLHPGDNALTEIRVSKFAGLGGGAGANVSRWHGDVGLDPVDDAHADTGQQVNLGGRTWTLHDYTGPANGGRRVIVAMTDAGGGTWFFKLLGPTDAVAKAKPEFDQFLASVKF